MKWIAPCATTPPPGGTVGRKTTHLPQELMTDQMRRLGVFSLVVAGCWTFGLFMDALLVPILFGAQAPTVAVLLEVAGLVVSVGMFLYVRFAQHAPETKAAVGLGYMILVALGVAIINVIAASIRMPSGPTVSWAAVVILIFSMISPTTPRRMLTASLIAASMDPLVMSIAYLRGAPALDPLMSFLHYLPNYVSAVIAMVPYHLLRGLGRKLREAQELGSYQLVERLGQGGMGEVWRAQHRMLARNAAIKLVRPEVLGGTMGDTAVIRRRFEREAQATAALSSPHTINLFDYGVTGEGTFYYVMELLAGRDLESLIREFGPVPSDRAVFLLRQACHSLADAHARGLVHRDIKPANIYVCRMGLEFDFVKVLDFGLVKYRGRGGFNETLQTVDHTTGTPAYMAPEIILGEADVDRRADVYALGCVAYYLLTGQLVFEAETPMKMLLQHVQAKPVPPSQRTELPIPKQIDDFVMACLEKDPDKRPQNAEVLLELACRCRECETWSNARAKVWWETHLPEYSGPLTVGDAVETSVVAFS
jgi:eukaryotic-like serine/threonine-protein kinase